jgi:predicted RNase H-like nuclease (RuvC/YqgF family)
MPADLPLNLILFVAGAFILGWILSAISSRTSNHKQGPSRRSNDHLIRSLEADQRVAQTDSEKSKEKREKLEDELKQTTVDLEKRDGVISHQQQQIDKFKRDLKVSVRKTRELREELTDRASENIRSEVKLREVETELEIAQVSADMIATGVLDYSLTADIAEKEVDEDVANDGDGDGDGDDGDDSVLGKAITDF